MAVSCQQARALTTQSQATEAVPGCYQPQRLPRADLPCSLLAMAFCLPLERHCSDRGDGLVVVGMAHGGSASLLSCPMFT